MESCRDSIPYSVHSSTAWVPSNHVASFFPDQSHCFIRPATDIPSACRTHTVRRPSACSALLFAAYADSSTSVAAGAGLAPVLDLPPVSSRHLRRASPRRVASSCVWGCGVVPCLPLHDGTWSMEHPWGHRHFEQIVTGSGTCWVWALGKKERLAMFPALWHLLIFRCLSSQNSRSSPSNERSWIWHLQLVSSARGSAARFMKATAYMLRVANDELHQNDGVLSQALI